MSEAINLSEKTVIELRKLAKELHVPLGAGISKQGIIDKLTAAISAGAGRSGAACTRAARPAGTARYPRARIPTGLHRPQVQQQARVSGPGIQPSRRPTALRR